MSHAPPSRFSLNPHAPHSLFSTKPHAPPSHFSTNKLQAPPSCLANIPHAPPSGFAYKPHAPLYNKPHAPSSCFQISFSIRCHKGEAETSTKKSYLAKRRHVLVAPLIAIGASVLKSAVAKAEENFAPVESAEVVVVEAPPPASEAAKVEEKKEVKKEVKKEEKKEEEEVMNSRIYDATVIGDPMAVGKESRKKVWEKLMNARVIYLGEAEQVPIGDDKDIELDIVKKLHKRCLEAERHLSLALEAFPLNLQEQLDQFMTGRLVII